MTKDYFFLIFRVSSKDLLNKIIQWSFHIKKQPNSNWTLQLRSSSISSLNQKDSWQKKTINKMPGSIHWHRLSNTMRAKLQLFLSLNANFSSPTKNNIASYPHRPPTVSRATLKNPSRTTTESPFLNSP